MQSVTLGTWRRPPLAYVVAELVISPYYSMEAAIPGLQDKLRAEYPRTVEAQELVFESNKPSAHPMWRLISADQRLGVQLGTRSISLHATHYIDSKDFLQRWANVLDAVGEANLSAFVERAGLRYVDLIVPTENRSPAAYLVDSLKGLTPEGATSTGSMWASVFQYDGFTVNLRTAAPSPAGMLLPPDFNPMPLDTPAVTKAAESFLNGNQPIGFIDTDCMKQIQHVFDGPALVSVYKEMQHLASRTFKAALSQTAREEWE